MEPQVEGLAREVEAARIELLGRLHGLTSEQGARKPSPDMWSVAEVVEHLVWAEHSGLNKMTVALDAWRRGEPVWTDPHPARDASSEDIVERTWRAKEKAPPIAEPRTGGPLAYWIAFFRSCQDVLEEVADPIEASELDDVIYPHYLSRPLTLRQRLAFLRFHIQRHHVQIEWILRDADALG